MRDIFEPRQEPAKSIYAIFQAEAEKRSERSIDEWQAAEREAVYQEAVFQAEKRGLRTPTIEEVKHAESNASGSIDFGAKWSYGIVEAMRKSA